MKKIVLSLLIVLFCSVCLMVSADGTTLFLEDDYVNSFIAPVYWCPIHGEVEGFYIYVDDKEYIFCEKCLIEGMVNTFGTIEEIKK